MPVVEEHSNLEASSYSPPLNYTFNRGIGGGQGGFHFVFNEGGLECSVSAESGNEFCIASPAEMNSYNLHRPSFIYLDCGAWVNNADGNNTRRRDFGLICGPHVYLCEFVSGGSDPSSNIPGVQGFFNGLAQNGYGVNVIQYARATHPLAPTTPTDPNIYLFLADLHLPPVHWFYPSNELSAAILLGMRERIPPNWLSNTPVFRRQRNHLYRNYYSIAQRDRANSHRNTHESDIFGAAGEDLVIFINGLCDLSSNIKSLLHFINLGDMFELWLGREYQFRTGYTDPQWRSNESINLVSDWALEIMIQNTPVLEAFNRLTSAGLAEVKFLWGNHDAYLKSASVTNQLGLLRRDPVYRGLNGDIFAEHGHRFDRSNHDNVSAWGGPAGANAAYTMPVLRSAEPMVRSLTSIGHASTMRDCYLLGATL